MTNARTALRRMGLLVMVILLLTSVKSHAQDLGDSEGEGGVFFIPAFRVGSGYGAGLGSGVSADLAGNINRFELGYSIESIWTRFLGGGTGMFSPCMIAGYSGERLAIGGQVGLWLSQRNTGVAVPEDELDVSDDGYGSDMIIGPSFGIYARYRVGSRQLLGFYTEYNQWRSGIYWRGSFLIGWFALNIGVLSQKGEPVFFIFPGVYFDLTGDD